MKIARLSEALTSGDGPSGVHARSPGSPQAQRVMILREGDLEKQNEAGQGAGRHTFPEKEKTRLTNANKKVYSGP
ncbi:MAG: hypothetical protein AB1641_16630 [Thermodesulfobacteriota bacterium]